MALPALSPGKSCVRVATGWPVGRHCRPAFLNSPISSFFLVSTLITGSAVAWWALTCSLMYRNWASRSGCRVPSRVLALHCRLNPLGPQQTAHGIGTDLMALGGQL